MRFTSTIIAGLFAVAYAQESTTASATTSADATTVETPSTTVSMSPEQSAINACLDACDAGDVDCKAACLSVPYPSDENISSNEACVSACPVGNGTEADISAYGSCVNGCIASWYYTSTGALAGGATATDTADGSDSTGGSDSGSDSGSADGTSTDSADGADSTGGSDDSAAGIMAVPTAAFGLAAFLAAFAAL